MPSYSADSSFFLFFIVPLLLLFLLSFLAKTFHPKKPSSTPSSSVTSIPKTYPVVGSLFSILAHRKRRLQWISDILQLSRSHTFVLHRFLGASSVFTADPAVVQHILKTRFNLYQKGEFSRKTLEDFLGTGIFNTDGENWKFQRQVSSHEFNTKSLRKFVETVVDTELSDRLVPILSTATENRSVMDFQDVLQRFAFDNICKIAFGYDPAYLLPSFPEAKFALAFEDGVRISSERFNSIIPVVWKVKRYFNIGDEKRLRAVVREIRGFANKIIEEKKHELEQKDALESVDLLSRFLSSGHSDETFVIDIVISFILAGRDTTSAALTWFFWLLSKNPSVEKQILHEIRNEKTESTSIYDEVKEMVYTHAALCESMRLYPPVPSDGKEAMGDDVLPDGTVVKKGMRVIYHPYGMGRLESIWGPDWAEFRPERWLERENDGKWRFVGRDSFTYSVFQAGPRICLGKEMAFLQMKRVVAGIMRQFRVVPVDSSGVEPEFVQYLTGKMKGGFPVKIEGRAEEGLE